MKIIVKIFQVPNLPGGLESFQTQIEKEIITQDEDGYELDKLTGDGSLVLLVFKSKK